MSLEYLDLSWNMLSGPLPSSLCPSAGSTLVNVFLSNNQLSGTINLTNCDNLVLFDVSMNYMVDGSIEAAPSGPTSNSHLSVAFFINTSVRLI